MLRFSLRESLLLILAMAMAIGWYVDRNQLNHRLDVAKKWRTCAGALEFAMAKEGWNVKWRQQWSQVEINRTLPKGQAGTTGFCLSTTDINPSPNAD